MPAKSNAPGWKSGASAVPAADRHDRLAAALVRRLVTGTATEGEAMVVLESVVLGVMLYYRPQPQAAGEFLDAMAAAVIARMP